MKAMKNLLIGLVLVGGVSACAGNETAEKILPKVVKSVDIRVDQDLSANKSMDVYFGVPTQLIAKVTYEDDTVEHFNNIAWASDNTTVMIVSRTGEVTLPKAVTTNTLNDIIGTFGLDTDGNEVEDTITLHASNAELESFLIDPVDPILNNIPGSMQLKANATYGTGIGERILNVATLTDWISVDTDIVTVDNIADNLTKGRITYVSNGGVAVTAEFNGETDTTNVTTVDSTLDSIEVIVAGVAVGNTPNIPEGYWKQLKAIGTYSDTHTADITDSATWSSTTEATITVNDDTMKGSAKAVAATGTSDITAEFGVITSDPVLVLTAVPRTAISITIVYPTDITTPSGTSDPTITGENTMGEITTPEANKFTWTSSAEGTATVAPTGVVTGVADGTAIITATLTEKGDLPGKFQGRVEVTITGQ